MLYDGKHKVSEDPMPRTKNDVLFVRVSEETKAAFTGRCERNGRSASDVLRELVNAWSEGRVTIQPHK